MLMRLQCVWELHHSYPIALQSTKTQMDSVCLLTLLDTKILTIVRLIWALHLITELQGNPRG